MAFPQRTRSQGLSFNQQFNLSADSQSDVISLSGAMRGERRGPEDVGHWGLSLRAIAALDSSCILLSASSHQQADSLGQDSHCHDVLLTYVGPPWIEPCEAISQSGSSRPPLSLSGILITNQK